MRLGGKDVRRLMYMERWTTYSTETGTLSLDEIIRRDGGKNFSSILSDKETCVQSFGMQNIPRANVLLVFGSYPRALAYAAEIAVCHFDAYGYYPEFVAAGDGRGMFHQRREMAEWFENMMIELGFDKDWVNSHHVDQPEKNRYYVAEIADKLDRVFCLKKTKVLAVTGAGFSLRAAQELPLAMPHIDFRFFEVPQLEVSARLFDNETFLPDSYTADVLLANVISVQMCKDNKIALPLEKKFSRPEMQYVRDLLLRGYAGCLANPKMWEFAGISADKGMMLHEERKAELQNSIKPRRFDEQVEQFLRRIRRSFNDRHLVIK